jgi:hypothetical protein
MVLKSHKRLFTIAIVVWLVTFLVVALLVYKDPTKRSVVPVYYNAVSNWLMQQDLYGNALSFHYLPQFVYVYMPFYHLGVPIGDILWRGLSLFIFVWGIFVFIKDNFHHRWGEYLLVATLLIVTPSIGALRNGQANLVFSALCVWAMVFLIRHQWWRCSLCLGLLVAVKQTGLILSLLAIAAYPTLIWRFALILLGLLVIPFLSADPAYALSQYKGALREMSGLATTKKSFADINGLLRAMGLHLEGLYSVVVRVVAGMLTLSLWLYARITLQQPLLAITFLGLATAYLMVFHPMTEQNSYVIVAPAISLTAIYLLQKGTDRWAAVVLIVICICLDVLPEVLRRWYPHLGLWFKPLCALIYLGLLTRFTLRKATQRVL